MTTPEKLKKKWDALSKRTKVLTVLAMVFVVVMIFVFAFVSPALKQLRNAAQGLERAKSGYAFILENAPALKNSGNVSGQVMLGIPVKDAVLQVTRDLKIGDVSVFEKNERNTVGVTVNKSLPFTAVADMLTRLENQYGIAVKEIVLDKQGDGDVYVTRLMLMRLEEGTNE